MGWKSEERKKEDELRHNILPSPVWLSGRGNLGEGLKHLMAAEWKGAGICVFVCGGWGDFWSLFMLPHYQLLTLAKRQGVCNMAQAWLYPRHGNPCGLQRRPGAHIGSVCWLGDKFPLVRWEGATSIMLLSFAAEERVWWDRAATRPGKHLSDNIVGAKRCLTEIHQHYHSTLQLCPCYQRSTAVSNTCWFCQGEINWFSIIKHSGFSWPSLFKWGAHTVDMTAKQGCSQEFRYAEVRSPCSISRPEKNVTKKVKVSDYYTFFHIY